MIRKPRLPVHRPVHHRLIDLCCQPEAGRPWLGDRVLQIKSICLLTLAALACLAAPRAGAADDTETESGSGAQAADQPVAASDEGQQAMSSFRKPEGWKISLFAAEPALANPVAIYVDHDGRLFVCETFRQDRGVTDNRKHDQQWLLADLSAETVQDRVDYHRRLLGSEADEYTAHDDRIRLLVDTDDDGVADQHTVFAEGFNQLEEGTGAGVLFRGDAAYYTCIPKLWQLRDSDGDGQAEQRTVLHDGYGVRVAFRGHDSHGLIIGPDGRLYFSIGDRGYNIETEDGRLKNVESGAVFRCELDGSGLEVFATGLRNPQELAFDDYGYLFTGDNNSDSGDKARWVNVMQGGDSGWRMMYQYLPDRGPFNREKLWEPYSSQTPAYIVPPIANIGDGPSGLTCYPGTGLTGDFANCFLMVDFRGGPSNSGIRLIRTQPRGAFWELERSEELVWNILATDVDFGPDGRLWICDWVNGWIGEGKGRVYRFEDPQAQQQDVVHETRSVLAAGFDNASESQLSTWLRHADRRIRLEAQWELAHRGALEALIACLQDATAGTIARLHAVWGLGQAARLQPELRTEVTPTLASAMDDRDLDVRAAAASVAGDLRIEELSTQVLQRIADDEPRVQYAACLAAGRLGLTDALEPTCAMLAANADRDPGLRHAGIMALAGMPSEQITALRDHESRSVRLAAVVALRKQSDTGCHWFLADSDPGVQLEAARAIHDVPALHSQLHQLAALELVASDASDALVHRVLNANFRLGTAAGAQRIAAVAGDSARSDAMRVEAVQMLGKWSEPSELDRVMNRYQPLEERSPEPAREALQTRFADVLSGSEGVVVEAIAAAVNLNIAGAADVLRQFALNTEQAAILRERAIRGLVELDTEASSPLLKQLTDDESSLVRSEALTQLALLDPDAALPRLAKAIQSQQMRERQSAWDALATIRGEKADQLIRQGVNDYLSGDLSPDVWLNVLEAAGERLPNDWQQKLEDFAESAAQQDSLEAYRDTMFGGDIAAGKTLFAKTELSCVRCHQVAGVGGEVGPDLTEIGKTKDNRYLLESIVNPDAKIADNFGTVVILTEDDQIISGILKKETPSKIELINAEGEKIEIDPIDVVHRKEGKSAMPVDLLKSMTRRELRDLVAYLSSLKGT